MYRFKGFAGIKSLISNTPNMVSNVGELSANSYTFAKDVKIYGGVSTDLVLYGFSSKNAAGDIDPSTGLLANIVEVAEWIISRQKSLTVDETIREFKTAIESFFINSCSSFIVGPLVQASNQKYYPTYITWKNTTYTAEDNEQTLYFCDETFQQLYDVFTIDVIPPISPIDSFFNSYTDVATILSDISYTSQVEKIQAARGGHPETLITAEEYNFINPNNVTNKTKTNWTFLIYGPRGNDPDAIKAALIDYIDKNSTHTTPQWQAIFPDIFKSTEFLFVPLWWNMAMTEMIVTTGIYSPVMRLNADAAKVKALLPTIPSSHFNTKLCFMTRPYKSLGMAVLGGEDNRSGKTVITDVFPDMISVASNSMDFSRMDYSTQKFLEKLDDMLYRAEDLKADTELPVGYRRAVRSGITYISMTYQNIRYLVAVKASI
jgi:hypothetical protein